MAIILLVLLLALILGGLGFAISAAAGDTGLRDGRHRQLAGA